MKKTSFIFALLIVSISSYTFAGYGENRFKKKIEKHILYPELSKEQQASTSVDVQFSVNAEGEIVIEKINSSNKEMIDYVIGKLKSIKAEKGSEVIGKTYSYHFSFEVQE